MNMCVYVYRESTARAEPLSRNGNNPDSPDSPDNLIFILMITLITLINLITLMKIHIHSYDNPVITVGSLRSAHHQKPEL